MTPRQPKSKKRPEAKIQDRIERFLKARDWVVRATHGNAYQSGFPDIYAAHRKYGARWVEVKNPLSYAFTEAQLQFFPLLASAGIGVWVLVDATQEEYEKLWAPPNWHTYLPEMKVRSRVRAISEEEYTPKVVRKIGH